MNDNEKHMLPCTYVLQRKIYYVIKSNEIDNTDHIHHVGKRLPRQISVFVQTA